MITNMLYNYVDSLVGDMSNTRSYCTDPASSQSRFASPSDALDTLPMGLLPKRR